MRRAILCLLAFMAAIPSAAAGPGRFDVLAIRPQAPGSIVCPASLSCVAASNVSGKPYLFDSAGNGWPAEETQAFLRLTAAPGSPSNGAVYYNTMTGLFQFYMGSWFAPVSQTVYDAAEKPFTRTCTLPSAAAVTPVTCLADADVPAMKKAYLLGWRAKVNGATAWATTANCYIADSSGAGGTGILFVTMAVAALTGNAFVGDYSANVTPGSAYALSSAGTAAKGLLIECNANGTGSNLVVTIFGVTK